MQQSKTVTSKKSFTPIGITSWTDNPAQHMKPKSKSINTHAMPSGLETHRLLDLR